MPWGDGSLPLGCSQSMLDDDLSGEAQGHAKHWRASAYQEHNSMRRFGESESKYLKGSDLLKPGGGYAVVNAVIESMTQEDVGEEREPKYILYFENKQKGMALNVTNETTLISLFGQPDDTTPEALTAHFAGKPIQIYFDPSVNFGGKRIGGLRLRAAATEMVSEKPQPAEPPKQNTKASDAEIKALIQVSLAHVAGELGVSIKSQEVKDGAKQARVAALAELGLANKAIPKASVEALRAAILATRLIDGVWLIPRDETDPMEEHDLAAEAFD